MARIIETFAKDGISIEHVPTSQISASVIFGSKQNKDRKLLSLLNELEKTNPDELSIDLNVGLVSVVGEGLKAHLV